MGAGQGGNTSFVLLGYPRSRKNEGHVEHVDTVRVIFGDTDAAGIVYYGNYLRWFEVGRAELMRRKGFSYLATMEGGVLLPVVEASAAASVTRTTSIARFRSIVRPPYSRKCPSLAIARGIRGEAAPVSRPVP